MINEYWRQYIAVVCCVIHVRNIVGLSESENHC